MCSTVSLSFVKLNAFEAFSSSLHSLIFFQPNLQSIAFEYKIKIMLIHAIGQLNGHVMANMVRDHIQTPQMNPTHGIRPIY